jgi:hypothetical protein
MNQSFKLRFSGSSFGIFVGHMKFDFPEVDGEVLISKEVLLKKGQFNS